MDQMFIEKALVELREDESRRVQSLVQFREWLAKHPFLSKVRQDDVHLLQFLRVRKFNMIEAFKSFEKYYLAKNKFADFIDFEGKNYSKMMELYEAGYVFPLAERDAEGRRIILFRFKFWDTEKFSPFDTSRLSYHLSMILMEEEETQISGISVIYDLQGMTMGHIITPMLMKKTVNFLLDWGVIRFKDIYILSLPSFAKFVIDFVLSRIKQKINLRICLLDGPGDLKNHIDPSLLPVEYGGTKTCAKMMDAFRTLREEKREKVREYSTSEIDWSKVPPESLGSKDDDEGVGSFRKLEID